VALCLKCRGWNIEIAKGSRGPADIIATNKNYKKWLIQVKSSIGIPHLKGYEVKRLREVSQIKGGLAVIATLQPTETVASSTMITTQSDNNMPIVVKGVGADGSDAIYLGNYAIFFYSLNDWKRIAP
jgi:hypothetical protein